MWLPHNTLVVGNSSNASANYYNYYERKVDIQKFEISARLTLRSPTICPQSLLTNCISPHSPSLLLLSLAVTWLSPPRITGGECDPGQRCDNILTELENIDDDTDDHGMHFVTTEETGMAQQYGVTEFPKLVLFRNGEIVMYSGEWRRCMVQQRITCVSSCWLLHLKNTMFLKSEIK